MKLQQLFESSTQRIQPLADALLDAGPNQSTDYINGHFETAIKALAKKYKRENQEYVEDILSAELSDDSADFLYKYHRIFGSKLQHYQGMDDDAKEDLIDIIKVAYPKFIRVLQQHLPDFTSSDWFGNYNLAYFNKKLETKLRKALWSKSPYVHYEFDYTHNGFSFHIIPHIKSGELTPRVLEKAFAGDENNWMFYKKVPPVVKRAERKYTTVIATNQNHPEQNFVIVPQSEQLVFLKLNEERDDVIQTSSETDLSAEQQDVVEFLKQHHAFNLG
jgi:hypothetical protein